MTTRLFGKIVISGKIPQKGQKQGVFLFLKKPFFSIPVVYIICMNILNNEYIILNTYQKYQ